MLFLSLSLSLFTFAAFSLVTANPIDPELQPIIASKNNLGLANPPTASTNAAYSSGVSSSFMSVSALTAASIAAALL
ncbi:hypothetical protein B0H10DRAFT_2207165 [Mycena sp. CBHHK59/15]|nr:hypothetical protein B0H10DRAFT_2207165 [Mycena sp. CBHHK59/15]